MVSAMDKKRTLLEKFIVISICLYNTYRFYPSQNLVLYFLIGIIFSSLFEVISSINIKLLIYITFALLCVFEKTFVFYIPIITYNLIKDFGFYWILLVPLLFSNFYIENLILTVFSVYVSYINIKHSDLVLEYVKTRDKFKEDSLLLEKYNDQLKKDKEKSVHIAILTERNRIAKELHDAIGHALSSSILQVESIKIISKEELVKDKLGILQDTLTRGMNDIRVSIHNLHNESFDLKEQIEKLRFSVPNTNIDLVYRLGPDISYDLKYDILSVVKEGITNCAKHSNASNIRIALLDQPKFYTLVIKDNGTIFNEETSKNSQGMGLLTLREIANKYNGFINTSFTDGFKIHMTLMKWY